ncbi:tape measure protein [Vreelandella populi]|uniref:tape measure protein n=1 Tax=Vreelandella populi TaxID=2498858 RepID=UPI00163C69AF|nr:tape measure protein [Halomonas populi]
MQTRYVINGDASGGIRVMRQMRNEVTGLGKEFDNSGQRSKNFGSTVKDVSQDIEFLKRTALSAGIAMAAMFSTRNTIGSADEYSQMASRIRLVTESTLEYDQVQQRMMQTARNTYKPLMDISELFVNTVRPLKEVGFATRDVLDLTEALSAGMVISGTKAQQSSSLMDQFSKGMIAGKLQGDAYNAVVQNAPRLQQALTDALGVTTQELDRMATAGELTANKVIPALNSQVGAMVDELERMPTSVEDARVVFDNAWLDYIGRANEAHSATGVLASGIELAADNIETLAEVGMAAGVVLAGRGVQALGSYTLAATRRAESDRLAAAETRKRMEQDRSAAAQAQRRATAERAQAAQEAQRAQQRAAQNSVEVAADVQRLQRLQTQLAAEKALAAQRLQAQTNAAGRMQVQTRIAQLNTAELAAKNQLTAASVRLAQAEAAEASATRLAMLAKVEYQRATATATAATLTQTAAARASALAHGSMALAVRGAQGAMALMGGPAGAALLATYGLYRLTMGMTETSREARAARQGILDLSTTAEDAVKSFEKLTLAQRNMTLQNVSSDIEDQEAQMRRSLNRIVSSTQAIGLPRNTLDSYRALRTAIDEVKEGVREAGTLANVISENFVVPQSHIRTVTALADGYDTSAISAKGLADRQRELEGAFGGATSSIDNQTRAMEANRSAANDYLKRVNESIAQTMDPSNEGRARRWIASQDGGVPPEIAEAIIEAERFRDQWDKDQEARRKAEQEATAAARQSEQMASAALRKQEQERTRIQGLYHSQALSMQREIALHGEIGDVARLRWELESGSLQGLDEEQQKRLLQLREELSLMERRSGLLSTYVPDLERLQKLQRDSMAIESLDPGLGNLAAKQLERELKNLGTQGLSVPTSIDASVSGPFGEADRLDRGMERYREQYQQRLEVLQEFTKAEYGVKEEAQQALAELERRHIETVEQYERQSRQVRMAGTQAMFGDLSGLAKTFAGEQSSIYRALFATEKAFAVGRALMNIPSSFSKAFDAVVGIPYVGPFLAPAAGAAAAGAQVAQASAIQAVGMSHAGVDRIPKEGTWLLDEGQRVMMSQQADELDRFLSREKRAANNSSSGGSNVQIDVEVINQGQPVQATATVERIGDDRFKVRVLQTMREDLASGASNSYAHQMASTYGMARGAR